MDERTALKPGTLLSFPGMDCTVETCVGRGSNAIVYGGSYPDAMTPGQRHHVLIKELFPWDPGGHIFRDNNLCIQHDSESEALWETHRVSFERGNKIHLLLLSGCPDQIGGNLNTFPLNGTFYTLLDDTGSISLASALNGRPAPNLHAAVRRMLGLLDALEIFHTRGMLHLDISPDNILLVGKGEKERTLLIDYNSSHTMDEIAARRGMIFSVKEGYTSPEVRTGQDRAISFSSDLYSAAAVFHACLTGRAPSGTELTRKTPPDGGGSPLLSGAPSTVREQTARILKRGLCALPSRRYRSVAEMRNDLQELLRRADGRGVTHASLWEAGHRNVLRLARRNPSLAYLEKETELYPLRVLPENAEESMTLSGYTHRLMDEEGGPVLLTGPGGAGKSTALLSMVLTAPVYSASHPAFLYLPLSEWRPGSGHHLLDRILQELRFGEETRTLEDARHALRELLSCRLPRKDGGSRAVLLLLLDGLNEVIGNPAELLAEIRQLSELPGLQILLAGRNIPEDFPARKAFLTPLTPEDVNTALGRYGLLPPESGKMKELLRTPLMLSLFIRTAQARDCQINCENERELIDGYLSALSEKEGEAGETERIRAEAAIRFVLPAVARQSMRKGGALSEPELLETVIRCRSLLRSRALSRAFPAWIGHKQELTGGREISDDSWYALIAHHLLWRRLGLLVREESGFQVQHQILRDYLAEEDAINRRALNRFRFRTGGILLSFLLLFCGLALGAWEFFLKPKPYDKTQSEIAVGAALSQYVNCGMQYQDMLNLLDGRLSPDAARKEILLYGTPVSASAKAALQAMRDAGVRVIPWSGQLFDPDLCMELLELPSSRAEEYASLIEAFSRAKSAGEETASSFRNALSDLLEADADIAFLLYRSTAAPHESGMNSDMRLAWETGLRMLPREQLERNPVSGSGKNDGDPSFALTYTRDQRRAAKRRLDSFAVMYGP